MYGKSKTYGKPYNPHVEETKKKMSPIVALVALGVLAIIFAIPTLSGSTSGTGTTVTIKDSSLTLHQGGTVLGSAKGGNLRFGAKNPALIVEDYSQRNQFTIRIITDLDQQSKEGSDEKPSFHALFTEGTLVRDPTTGRFSVEWGRTDKLVSKHNEAGRGMELSELIMYNSRLFTVEDRTGIVYEILDFQGPSPYVVPRLITSEGDGDTDKGMKLEWATVRNGELWLGSFGKEYTRPDGSVLNRNNLWVIVADAAGRTRHLDWTPQYKALERAAGAHPDGYLIHEAINWSDILQKWVVLPRRVSKDPYDEVADEKHGANLLLLASEGFDEVRAAPVGRLTPERGFSTFKFVPGTQDQVIVAIKSEENAELDTQSSWITVFTLDGDILLDETEIPGGVKYEGLEFIL
mmetsp:Transcript_8821/g.16917  ORF Transcript_8821/g.16917 Transcript_8821/m.16917 type:complete len:406 (-) Transcript_8821:225-1442(-)